LRGPDLAPASRHEETRAICVSLPIQSDLAASRPKRACGSVKRRARRRALEGELASALIALDAEDYEETRALLVRARGELARAVSGREVGSAAPAPEQA
jgi:hypothetical protein